MKLFKGIHDRWAADSTLSALLASTKFVSGMYQAASLATPYAVLKRPGDGEPQDENCGDCTEFAAVQIVLYHSDYDDGLAIAKDIRNRAFKNASFTLADGEVVMNMHRAAGYSETQQADGTWQFVIPFLCQISVEA